MTAHARFFHRVFKWIENGVEDGVENQWIVDDAHSVRYNEITQEKMDDVSPGLRITLWNTNPIESHAQEMCRLQVEAFPEVVYTRDLYNQPDSSLQIPFNVAFFMEECSRPKHW